MSGRRDTWCRIGESALTKKVRNNPRPHPETPGMDIANADYKRAVAIVTRCRARAHVLIGSNFADTWNLHYAAPMAPPESFQPLLPWLELIIVHIVEAREPVGAILEHTRAAAPHCRVLVATDTCAPAVINAASRYDVSCVVVEDDPRAIAWHAERDATLAASRARRLVALGARHRLTGRQMAIVALSIRGWKQSDIASLLGVALTTVKTHVHRLLRGTNSPSLAELIDDAGAD